MMPGADGRHCVWFYLEASANQTNRTRQNETRRQDESRRIKMNRTLQDESRRIKMNRTLQDESRRIKMNRTLQDESNESGRIWVAAMPVCVPASARKFGEMRTNSHEFASNPLPGR